MSNIERVSIINTHYDKQPSDGFFTDLYYIAFCSNLNRFPFIV